MITSGKKEPINLMATGCVCQIERGKEREVERSLYVCVCDRVR